jgi:protein-tyrosine-phosphatase
MTDSKIRNVLFVCTGNSARSILAEGILNNLGRGKFKAYSAGSHPKGEVHPLALETLAKFRMSTEGCRSKNWDEFSAPSAPVLDFVFTVCDKAAGEMCPVWPGQPMTAHWGVPDPSEVEGSDDDRRHAFGETVVVLKRRIELLLSLPLTTLDSMSIRREIQAIGLK